MWPILGAGDDREETVYDRRAALYDHAVRSPLYNALLWSASPADYERFALRATRDGDGPLLDVPAGAASATAAAHASSGRPTTLCDLSPAMLEVAARRIAAAGGSGERFTLRVADLTALPFAPASFPTILCMGLLHILEPARIVGALQPLLAPGGRLYLSGLIGASRRSRAALGLLHRLGETDRPRTLPELAAALDPVRELTARGAMAYAVIDALDE